MKKKKAKKIKKARKPEKESPFEKFRGIGNPGIGKGKKAIMAWMREIRGY